MAETKIVPFLFEGEITVRVIERVGLPWFVAKDVCQGIGIADVSTAVSKLDDDEKGACLTRTLGGEQEVLVVSESGLYTLILRSRQATTPGTVAHRFRKWVTSEVIPAIRQTGHYDAVAIPMDHDDDDIQTADGLKLKKVNTAARVFGERAGAQLWVKLGLEMVPAMRSSFSQMDMLEIETVSVTTRMSSAWSI